jgi:hypothetical protein
MIDGQELKEWLYMLAFFALCAVGWIAILTTFVVLIVALFL